MTKDSLIAYVAEKARISTQRAELVYEAFWEAILSELKTGHFSLPVGKGTLQVREKTPATSKMPEKKVEKKSPVKVPAKGLKATKSNPKSKKPAAKKVSKGKKISTAKKVSTTKKASTVKKVSKRKKKK